VAYAIGKAQPVGVFIETFGTGTVPDERIQDAVLKVFDLRPAAIIADLAISPALVSAPPLNPAANVRALAADASR
jgi:S-adenosylmethionine synthetase